MIEPQNGLLAYDGGKFEEAERWYRKSLAIREDPITRGNLANALKAQGKMDEAEAHCLNAIECQPQFPNPYP